MSGLHGYSGLVQEADGSRWLVEAASTVMVVRSARWMDERVDRAAGRPVPAGMRALEIRGRLLVDPERAYHWLSELCRGREYVLLLRQEGSDLVALALPGRLPDRAGRPWVALALFAATLFTVLSMGAAYDGATDILSGWPYAASLLGILVAHEMGHYVAARRLGVPASLPYFIPMPIPPLGTMGAVIQTKAPPVNRQALLMLGAAGPLAGLVVAVPVLILGLSMSTVGPSPPFGYIQEGNSLLYVLLKLALFGHFLPSNGFDVQLSSVAWAGWAGLLVTALNLIPAGQLDGGHITYAVLGRRARWLTWPVVAVLLGLSTLWPGWLLWAGLVLFLGRVHSVPLNDVTELSPRHRALAALCLAVFVLVFVPVPMVVH